MYSISPQPDASLFFNAPEGPDGNVTHRMRRSYSAWFRAVLELLVASLMSNIIPTFNTPINRVSWSGPSTPGVSVYRSLLSVAQLALKLRQQDPAHPRRA